MHELSIALSVLELVEEQAELNGYARVAAVHLKLGKLSGVVPEALRSAYDLAREGTALADCELLIEEVPVVVYCPSCALQREIESIQMLVCAVCGTPTPEVLAGREMEVSAMEICQ